MKGKTIRILIFFLIIIFVLVIIFYFFLDNEGNKAREKETNFLKKEERILSSYKITVDYKEFDKAIRILNKINKSTNDITELKKLMKEEIDIEFKAFLFRAYSNYNGIKNKLLKNETIFCKDIALNTINLNYIIYSVYGTVETDDFFHFSGNWTTLILDLKKEISKIKDDYLIIKALKKCKI